MSERYGDRYDKYTSSFSGADMVVSFVFPESAPVIIGTATTINYSIYRQLAHVRTMGRITPKGYARGGRTCAGTIIFTVINESIVEELRRKVSYLGEFKSLKPDELPPFDIILTSGNEFGQSSTLVVYGASIVDESMALSIEDIFTENVFTFLSRDIQHMKAGEQYVPLSGQIFRGQDENLGKFTLAELIATQEDAERRKRLEEIAAAEAERYKFPVLTDPATAPSDSAGGGSSDGGGTAPGTPGEGTIGKVVVTVVEQSGSSITKLKDATVTSNGVTVKTDANGIASFTPKYGTEYTYTATKSGYTEASKKVNVTKTEGSEYVSITLNKVAAPGTANKDRVANVTFNGPSAYTGAQNHVMRLGEMWKKDEGPMVKLTNAYGDIMEDVRVDFNYVIQNGDQCPWYKKAIFRAQWPVDKGPLGWDKSSKYGNARIPVFNLDGLFDGCIIEVIAKPYSSPVLTTGFTNQSLWRSWFFEKQN